MGVILTGMKEVKIKGKTYIRTAAAAKLYGYSQDYLGQLSREGRIAAKRVGRSWFVDPDSVAEYQRELEAETTTAEESSQQPEKYTEHSVSMHSDNRAHHVSIHTDDTASATEKSSPTTFEERIAQIKDQQKKTISDISDNRDISSDTDTEITQNSPKEAFGDESRIQKKVKVNINISARKDSSPRWHQANYEPDATALHPEVKKIDHQPSPGSQKKVSKDETEESLPTRTLRVHSNTDQYSIVPSEMPSVRLRGRIAVKGEDEVKELPSLSNTKQKIAALPDSPDASSDISGADTDAIEVRSSKSSVLSTDIAQDIQKTTTTSSLPPGSYTPATVTQQTSRQWPITLAMVFVLLLVSYLALSIGLTTTIDSTTGTTSTSWYFVPFSLSELGVF